MFPSQSTATSGMGTCHATCKAMNVLKCAARSASCEPANGRPARQTLSPAINNMYLGDFNRDAPALARRRLLRYSSRRPGGSSGCTEVFLKRNENYLDGVLSSPWWF